MSSSIKKKLTTLKRGGMQGVKSVYIGVRNFTKNDPAIEQLAEQRILTCIGCEHYTREPNALLRIEDSRILEADEMMCGDCGCALPYKIRQSISKCIKWKK